MEFGAQALVPFKKYMPPPLPYFKVNIHLPFSPSFKIQIIVPMQIIKICSTPNY
jgi:hypothetical protein